MSDKETKERIKKDSVNYASLIYNKGPLWRASSNGYIAGAESERPKAWNYAIDACIKIIERADGDGMVYTKFLIKELESEKHKQP